MRASALAVLAFLLLALPAGLAAADPVQDMVGTVQGGAAQMVAVLGGDAGPASGVAGSFASDAQEQATGFTVVLQGQLDAGRAIGDAAMGDLGVAFAGCPTTAAAPFALPQGLGVSADDLAAAATRLSDAAAAWPQDPSGFAGAEGACLEAAPPVLTEGLPSL